MLSFDSLLHLIVIVVALLELTSYAVSLYAFPAIVGTSKSHCRISTVVSVCYHCIIAVCHVVNLPSPYTFLNIILCIARYWLPPLITIIDSAIDYRHWLPSYIYICMRCMWFTFFIICMAFFFWMFYTLSVSFLMAKLRVVIKKVAFLQLATFFSWKA